MINVGTVGNIPYINPMGVFSQYKCHQVAQLNAARGGCSSVTCTRWSLVLPPWCRWENYGKNWDGQRTWVLFCGSFFLVTI